MKWIRSRREFEERELAAEIEAHIALAVHDRMSRGESRKEAEANARREFGNRLLVEEATRRRWPGARLDQFINEFRIALRTLARTPRFALAALFCIAMGVGVTTTIISAMNAVLLHPLPYAEEDELVSIRNVRERKTTRKAEFTQAEIEVWRSSRTLSGIATWRGDEEDLRGAEGPAERIKTASITSDLLPMLGVQPVMGRVFDEQEGVGEDSDVVILSHGLWLRRYGGDPAIIGRSVDVSGTPQRVIGVMPARFDFPQGVELWSPLGKPDIPADILFYGGAIGRIKPGVEFHEVSAEFSVLSDRLKKAQPESAALMNYRVLPLREDLLGSLRKPVLVFQLAAVLVLLIACANVAALQLARSAARTQEYALRAAIGAGGWRLAGHVLIESLAVALPGGLLGVGVALIGVRLIAASFPDGVPTYLDLSVKPLVVVAAMLVTIIAAVMFALPSVARVRRARGAITLEPLARGGGRGGLSQTRWRTVLIGGEVATSLVLAVAAILLVRTDRALTQSIGFTPDHVLSLRVPLPYRRYPAESVKRSAFYQELQQRVRAIPGVTAVTATGSPPPLAGSAAAGFSRFNTPSYPEIGTGRPTTVHFITPDFATTLGVEIRRGRNLSWKPVDGHEVLVNESFVKTYFPKANPIGVSIEVDTDDTKENLKIVGVLADFRHERPPADVAPALYRYDPTEALNKTILIRTSLRDPIQLAQQLRNVVRQMDESVVTSEIQTVESVVARAFWKERLQRNVVTVFAVIALLLAVSGVYGVLTYAVSQRTSEFGIRLALGASGYELQSLVLREALTVSVAAIAVGIAFWLAVMRVMRGMFYGVEATNVATLAGAAAAMILLTAGAALAPARRAAKLNPVTAILR